jgi:hypothetical protein
MASGSFGIGILANGMRIEPTLQSRGCVLRPAEGVAMPELTVFGELFFGGIALIVAGFVALFVVCVIGGATVDVFRRFRNER